MKQKSDQSAIILSGISVVIICRILVIFQVLVFIFLNLCMYYCVTFCSHFIGFIFLCTGDFLFVNQ